MNDNEVNIVDHGQRRLWAIQRWFIQSCMVSKIEMKMKDNTVDCAVFYNTKTGIKMDFHVVGLGGYFDRFCSALSRQNRDKKWIHCWWITRWFITPKVIGFGCLPDGFCGALSRQKAMNNERVSWWGFDELCGWSCSNWFTCNCFACRVAHYNIRILFCFACIFLCFLSICHLLFVIETIIYEHKHTIQNYTKQIGWSHPNRPYSWLCISCMLAL